MTETNNNFEINPMQNNRNLPIIYNSYHQKNRNILAPQQRGKLSERPTPAARSKMNSYTYSNDKSNSYSRRRSLSMDRSSQSMSRSSQSTDRYSNNYNMHDIYGGDDDDNINKYSSHHNPMHY